MPGSIARPAAVPKTPTRKILSDISGIEPYTLFPDVLGFRSSFLGEPNLEDVLHLCRILNSHLVYF